VAALLEGVGSAAVTATFNECKNSDLIIVIGANPTENHPVAATFFKQAAKRGAKLIVMDPRGQALKRHAWKMMQFKNGTDVAMLNAMLNVIVGEKLYDQQYVADLCRGLRTAQRARQGFHAGGNGADLRPSGRHHPRSRARLCPRRKRHHLLGHGHVATAPTAPTMRAV
jgi:anaerobic selenocysteine-containing dehydrogenase